MTRGNYYIILVTGLASAFFAIATTLILFLRPEWAFPKIVLPEPHPYQAEVIVPDFVHITRFEQNAIVGSDAEGFAWTGLIEVQNEQSIPVSDAIITVQAVHANGVEYHQFITNPLGVAAFSLILPQGSYRLEILDITGANYRYNRKNDALRSISGIANVLEDPEL